MTWMTRMIEAMSQFEIPRRSSVGPRHRQVSGTGPPGTVCEQCSFYGNGMQHPNSCYRYYMARRSGARCRASGRDSVMSTLRAAMAGPQ